MEETTFHHSFFTCLATQENPLFGFRRFLPRATQRSRLVLQGYFCVNNPKRWTLDRPDCKDAMWKCSILKEL